MQKKYYSAYCFFNILFILLLFDSLLESEDLFCICGAMQALISDYIQLIKETIRRELVMEKLIYNHHIETNLQSKVSPNSSHYCIQDKSTRK